MKLFVHRNYPKKVAAIFSAVWMACVFVAATSSYGAYVEFTMTNSIGQPDTNYIKLYQVNSTANADGSYTSVGVPKNIYPNTNGYVKTNLAAGTWLATNSFIASPYFYLPGASQGTAKGVVFNVDNSTNTYPFTRYLRSGYNIYNWYLGVTGIIGTNGFTVITNNDGTVTLDGSDFAPTEEMITNALGFFPLSPTETTNAITNAVTTATNTLFALLGSAAFSNSAAFQPATTTLSNFSTLGITNFQKTNSVLTDYATLGTNAFYPRSNPSNFISGTLTNGFATTNALANLSNSVTASFAAIPIYAFAYNVGNPNGVLVWSNAALAISTNGDVYWHPSGTNNSWSTLIGH